MRLGRTARVRKGYVDAASATAITEMQSAACWGPSVTHLETRGFEGQRTPVQEDAGELEHAPPMVPQAYSREAQGGSWIRLQPRSRPAVEEWFHSNRRSRLVKVEWGPYEVEW